jgi:hypothetical protein
MSAHNSAASQCNRLLDYLREHKRITSLEATRKLDIYHPPRRIFELRAKGYNIITEWVIQETQKGKKHRIGLYVLLSDKGAV